MPRIHNATLPASTSGTSGCAITFWWCFGTFLFFVFFLFISNKWTQFINVLEDSVNRKYIYIYKFKTKVQWNGSSFLRYVILIKTFILSRHTTDVNIYHEWSQPSKCGPAIIYSGLFNTIRENNHNGLVLQAYINSKWSLKWSQSCFLQIHIIPLYQKFFKVQIWKY